MNSLLKNDGFSVKISVEYYKKIERFSINRMIQNIKIKFILNLF